MWKRFNILVLSFPSNISEIIGLQAASTVPLPNPTKNVDNNKVQKPPEKIVITRPITCVKKATQIIFLGPNTLYKGPPMIMAIGKPKKAIWLT